MELHGKVTVKFKRGFSSPILGNVWEGRTATLPHKQALKFIEADLAEQVTGRKGGTLAPNPQAAATGIVLTPGEEKAAAKAKKEAEAEKKKEQKKALAAAKKTADKKKK